MKEGWEKKKIKDVCYKGSSNIVLSKVEDNTGDYPLYGASGFVKNIDFFHNDKPYIGIVKDGSGVGRVNVYPAFSSLVGTLQYIFPKDSCSLDYLAYCLKSLDLSKFVNGAAIPHIYFKDYGECVISVPPLSVQESIVSELDMLSGIISKHKALQEEYDRLEQSIFYDMFGDPVTNEKGWEVKKLGEVCDKITDGTHNSPKNTPEGDYMYVTAKNIKKEGIILDDITYIDSETHKSIYARCTPTYGDILYIKDGATTGIATINQLKQEFSLLSSVALIKPSSILNNYYLKEVLNEPSMYIKIRGNMGGAAITRLTLSKINNIEIPLPPLSLQQSFADKISAIEQMKAKNKAAQEEAEMLFNERMAYYF